MRKEDRRSLLSPLMFSYIFSFESSRSKELNLGWNSIRLQLHNSLRTCMYNVHASWYCLIIQLIVFHVYSSLKFNTLAIFWSIKKTLRVLQRARSIKTTKFLIIVFYDHMKLRSVHQMMDCTSHVDHNMSFVIFADSRMIELFQTQAEETRQTRRAWVNDPIIKERRGQG